MNENIETQKSKLRTKLKAIEYQKSKVSQKIAEQVGITGSYFIEDLDINNPSVNPYDREKLLKLDKQIHETTWELDQLEYNDESIRHNARQKVFDKITSLPINEAIEFLHKYNCNSTLELIEKIVSHPELMEMII